MSVTIKDLARETGLTKRLFQRRERQTLQPRKNRQSRGKTRLYPQRLCPRPAHAQVQDRGRDHS